jgi:ribonuclease III
VTGADDLQAFQQRLNYRFRDETFLQRALTHKSYAHEARGRERLDNETFEFLGDSVLGFIVGDILFHRFPAIDEGALSKMKAYLVSAPILARKARNLGMGEVLYLGVGEERSGGRNKDSLLANLFEAVIAAIYLDGGIDRVRELITSTFQEDVEAISSDDLLFHDYKTALQEAAQADGLPLPDYSVVGELGPDHEKRFVVEVRLANSIIARGEGSSKKIAQQQAAREALRVYEERAAETSTK